MLTMTEVHLPFLIIQQCLPAEDAVRNVNTTATCQLLKWLSVLDGQDDVSGPGSTTQWTQTVQDTTSTACSKMTRAITARRRKQAAMRRQQHYPKTTKNRRSTPQPPLPMSTESIRAWPGPQGPAAKALPFIKQHRFIRRNNNVKQNQHSNTTATQDGVETRAHLPISSRITTTTPGASTIQSYLGRGTSNPARYTSLQGPRTESGELYNDQDVGTIVKRYHVMPYKGGRPVPASWELFKDKDGVQKLRKWRCFVIVGKQDDKIMERAIYTNGGTGLRHVSADHHLKYYSLRPLGVSRTDFENQVPEHDVLFIDWMRGDRARHMLRPTMIVNWKEGHERPINEDELHVVRTFAAESVRVLLDRIARRF
ncbi:uncharacterized protein LTR77_007608 [Saxophila tyrrhenica]|uniref:Uncharacterized protein n=1 Tax=Saxophila tyrrhenica TaxID=1690608 RepID=A0AAV9P2J0_9PEZI|nr:hypothetical protein LTR77_007608 [Saxophila tyrrhenica]